MELTQISQDTGTVALWCTHCPGNDKFRLMFRRSASAQKYSEHRQAYGGEPHPPDVLVAICINCKNEITITDNSGPKLNIPDPESYAFTRHMEDTIRDMKGAEYRDKVDRLKKAAERSTRASGDLYGTYGYWEER